MTLSYRITVEVIAIDTSKPEPQVMSIRTGLMPVDTANYAAIQQWVAESAIACKMDTIIGQKANN